LIWRLRILAATVTVALSVAPALARAEVPVPTQGPWSGITSVGLPVHFTVEGSTVVAARFGFHWGFCGDFEGEAPGPATIDPEGHWSLADSRGAAIEGTVVAPDRIEGAVDAVERMLPGCPSTHATFFAVPGETPPPVPPQFYAVMNTESGFQIRLPELIYLGRQGSLALIHLQWTGWGEPVAHAVGEAEVRQHKREYSLGAKATLSRPIADGPHRRLYSYLRFTLTGPRPPRYPRTGWFKFDRHGVVSASDGRWPGGPGYVRHRR
jgi:hypothetical protein